MKQLCLPVLLALAAVLDSRAEPQLQRLYTSTTSSNPPTCLVQGNDGNFYGTFIHEAFLGSSGSVFRMSPAGAVSSLGTISGLNNGLALAADGNLYGTTTNGGLGHGTIFKVSPSGQISTVYSFAAGNGSPTGIREGLDGSLYGACEGTNNFLFLPQVLNIFRFDTNGTLAILHAFTNSSGVRETTSLPVQTADGFLYGSKSSPKLSPPPYSNATTIFYRLSTNGSFQTIFTFTNSPGAAGDLVVGPDGSLYGVIGSRRGFPTTDGSVFKLGTNGVFTNLFSFNGTSGSDAEARLLSASDGLLYGTTYSGGSGGSGTLFRISTNGELAALVNFDAASGGNPLAGLMEGGDGNIYGTTKGSPFSEFGTIFRLVQSPAITSLVLTSGSATLTWNSFTNGIYRVESKPDLSASSWTLIQKVTAMDSTISITDASPAPDNRLYRVVLLP